MYYHDVTGKEWYVQRGGGKWGENGEQTVF